MVTTASLKSPQYPTRSRWNKPLTSNADGPIRTNSDSRADRVSFGSLDIMFDRDVLPPRSWTIEQSRWAAELMSSLPSGHVLEVCAGAGHIGLAALRDSDRHMVLVDDSEHACRCAAENAERAALGVQVEVRQATVRDLAAADERYALVIADPPWVQTRDLSRFPTDPRHAIDGGPDGLGVVRECLALASTVLIPGGAALLQLGSSEQAVDVATLLRSKSSRLHVREVRRHEPDGVVVLLS